MPVSPLVSLPSLPCFDWPPFPPGNVWVCGAGPGDPGLLTLAALNALQQADVIVYDALVNADLLAWGNPKAKHIDMGKRGGHPSPPQQQVSQLLIDLARKQQRVLRLKGGDPFVFGRGGEEVGELLAANIPVRVICGITSGISALAYAGIPLTHRDINHSVTFVTGHNQPLAKNNDKAHSDIDWCAIARASPIIVIYMGLRRIGEIAAALCQGGRDEHETVTVISKATTAEQCVLSGTLATIAQDIQVHGIAGPAVICVGQVQAFPNIIGHAGGQCIAPQSGLQSGPESNKHKTPPRTT